MDSAVPWVSALLTAGRAYAPLSRRTLTGVRFCLGGAPKATSEPPTAICANELYHAARSR